MEEKALVFNGIEIHCGVPHGVNGLPGHWDNWKDSIKKKHKGSGVDALEKARINPGAWGLVDNKAVVGEAPSRLPRACTAFPTNPTTPMPIVANVGVAPTLTPWTGGLMADSPYVMSTTPNPSPVMNQLLTLQQASKQAQLAALLAAKNKEVRHMCESTPSSHHTSTVIYHMHQGLTTDANEGKKNDADADEGLKKSLNDSDLQNIVAELLKSGQGDAGGGGGGGSNDDSKKRKASRKAGEPPLISDF